MTIMDDLISRHLLKVGILFEEKKMITAFCFGVQWEAKSPVPSVSFKTLIKQVMKLHENLVDILPHTQLQVD